MKNDEFNIDKNNIFQELEKGVLEVFKSEKYKEFLETMSKFHNYSYRNLLLINFQNPNATYVAGYSTWKSLGRQVNKGEKGIKIIAPMILKKQDENGKDVEYLHFKNVTVFDISQTNGTPLHNFAQELQGSVNNYDKIINVIEKISPPVEYKDLKDNLKGYYSLNENKIYIKSGMSEEQTLKTFIHELAHSRLHLDRNSNKTTSSKEIEAESIAFVVSKKLGVDTSNYSFEYIATWSSKDIKELKNSLDIIQKEANSIIKDIEEEYNKLMSLSKDNKIENKINLDVKTNNFTELNNIEKKELIINSKKSLKERIEFAKNKSIKHNKTLSKEKDKSKNHTEQNLLKE